MPIDRKDLILLCLMLCTAVLGSALAVTISIEQAAERCAPTAQATD